VPGLPASTITRLKEVWVEEHKRLNERDLSTKHYVYVWADGESRSALSCLQGAMTGARCGLTQNDAGYRSHRHRPMVRWVSRRPSVMCGRRRASSVAGYRDPDVLDGAKNSWRWLDGHNQLPSKQ